MDKRQRFINRMIEKGYTETEAGEFYDLLKESELEIENQQPLAATDTALGYEKSTRNKRR